MLSLYLFLVGAVRGQISCSVSDYDGCYTDFVDGKTRAFLFPMYTGEAGQLTQENCAAYCYRFGFPRAGVEFGSQCFCGDEFNPLAKVDKVDDAECNVMQCNGNSSQVCGDANRMLVYRFTCSGTGVPNYKGCLNSVAKALPYCNTSLTYRQRAQDLVSRLTLSEKVASISPQPDLGNTCGTHTAGSARLGLPDYFWLVETNTAIASACLGPDVCAITFNGPMGFGASFNRTSWNLKGKVMGTEMRAFGNIGWHRGTGPRDLISLTGFGPNINIARDPRFGRNSELPGEDPLLSGSYANAFVKGMQTEDAKGRPMMNAFLKHFTAYSRETNRGHDDYTISPHDLFDTYLPQYELAFEANPAGAMCSYNAVNGAPSCANDFVLNQILRKRWQHPDALITTDCGAVSNLRGPPVNASTDAEAAAIAINNGTDIEMGSLVFTQHLEEAVTLGLVTEARVTEAVLRSYLPLFKSGRFDPLGDSEWDAIGMDAINSTFHQQVQFEAALQSFVLLDNIGHLLPLARGTSLAVLGPMGQTRDGLLSDYANDQQCFEGQLCMPTIAEAFQTANTAGATSSAAGVDVNSDDASGIPAALELAKAADVVVLVLGNDRGEEHEGKDRVDTALPGLQSTFALQVLALGKPTVLVLVNGGAIAIDELMPSASTPTKYALVEAFSPSVQGARALAEQAFGDHNKWGRLPVTMYDHSFITDQAMDNYDMTSGVGRTYKYYTGKPLYPFGHGLSLTSFEVSCTQGASLSFSCQVANKGDREGDEVVMVYHAVGDAIRRQVTHPVPLRALIAFERVTVAAGQMVNVEFQLDDTVCDVINEEGTAHRYAGEHLLSFWGGEGLATTFSITV